VFTGIIETTGKVITITENNTNKDFWIESIISTELKIDQSVSHNGVCLTVTQLNGNMHKVTAILETLNVTNLKHIKPNSIINLERCMPANGRFDGHIVQGHIDETALVKKINYLNGSWEIIFALGDDKNKNLLVNKGSICINGVSLTVVKTTNNVFNVAIIPYTWENTNFKYLKEGDIVNIEFDIVGKYITGMLNKTGNN